ncbi:MAG: enolase C-terminal domain-like protein [Pseudomonadota bacterium]
MPARGAAPALAITALSAYAVRLTSHVPYEMAEGKRCEAVTSVLLRLETDAGLVGWGEVCPIPGYLPAYAAGVAPALAELAPHMLGADPLGAEALMHRLDAVLPGHPYVKSAIDIALWDLTAQAAALPLYALLGGRHAADLPLYHSISCLAPERMAAIAREAQATGIAQFQVKLGADADWRRDVERIMAVREAVGTGPLVYADWNCGATTLDAIRTGRAVAHLDVMLEQPCKSLEACAEVRRATGLAMKIDENGHDTASILRGHALGCMDVVAVKLSKFGGLSAARRARDLCLARGIQMVIEDVWGSDVTTAAGLHLAAATPAAAVLNVCDLSGYVSPRLDPAAPTRAAGRIAPPAGPGLGAVPDPALLGAPVFSA